MLLGTFLSEGFVYPYNKYQLRAPLSAVDAERISEARYKIFYDTKVAVRKFVFSQSFNAERDRAKIKEIAISFIDELERKLGTGLLSFDEIGISDSCYELVFNIMMYGNGGSITINYTQEKNGIEAIEVIGIDAGEGMENPNELLQQSIRAYAKWVEYDIGTTEEEPPPHGGYGFRNIVIFPEEVIIETRGIKWIKVGTEEKDLALQRAGSSDIEKGTKITLIWPLYQEEKFREMVRDELRTSL